LQKKIVFTNRKNAYNFLKFNLLAVDSSLIKFFSFIFDKKRFWKNSFFFYPFSLIAKYRLYYDILDFLVQKFFFFQSSNDRLKKLIKIDALQSEIQAKENVELHPYPNVNRLRFF